MMGLTADNPVFTVSGITDILKELIESPFGTIRVQGEVSNFRPSSTGHWYFTLKDEKASIQIAMFKNRITSRTIRPSNGQNVQVTGSLSLYAPRGSYQLVADTLEETGLGEILLRLQRLKKQLEAEGLFSEERKRQIVRNPRRVAVITSPTGAALRDILQVLERRNSSIEVLIYPAAVQGQSAAPGLCRMVELAGRHAIADVLILARGGGSFEDLLPFSDEELTRAVASCPIPVISAVGHQTDWSLTDYAADLRVPTPSAAAELVSGDQQEMTFRVQNVKTQMTDSLTTRIEQTRQRLSLLGNEYLLPQLRERISTYHMRCDHLIEEARWTLSGRCESSYSRLLVARTSIENNSIDHVLSRGFAYLTEEGSAQIITSTGSLQERMPVEIHLKDGSVKARIEKKEKRDG